MKHRMRGADGGEDDAGDDTLKREIINTKSARGEHDSMSSVRLAAAGIRGRVVLI